MPSTTTYEYLDPVALCRLKNLSLAARKVVEGYFAGMHKSPHKGFSIEFAEHREYTPGIDPRHIDWRVLGRRDKLYVKQYEEEICLRCHLIIDKSGVDGLQVRQAPLTKLEYACYLAASLAYLMAFQHDAAGLVTFDTAVRDQIPPRRGRDICASSWRSWRRPRPAAKRRWRETFHRLAETLKRRSLVIILSDLFDDPDRAGRALKHFRHKKHEVIVFQILDPAEVSFPFDDVTRIEDMENGREITSDPRAFRNAYLEEFGDFLDSGARRLPLGRDRPRGRPDRPALRPVPGQLPGPPPARRSGRM